jgi:hypothetical protein
MTNRTAGSISVVVPTYGNAQGLESLAMAISKVLQAENRTFEIVFVNDGSPDGTWDTILRINASNEFLPLLYEQFDMTPSARSAFFRLNEDLLPTIRSRTKMLPKLREFRRPVRIIFGDADPYLIEASPSASMGSFQCLSYFFCQVLDTSSKWMSLHRWHG